MNRVRLFVAWRNVRVERDTDLTANIAVPVSCDVRVVRRVEFAITVVGIDSKVRSSPVNTRNGHLARGV